MAGENANEQASALLVEANKKLEQSQSANADLQKEVAALKQEVEVLTVVNEELSAKLAEVSEREGNRAAVKQEEATEELKLPKEGFSIAGKQYHFVAPVFTHNKQRVTAVAALKDQDLLAHLVKIGSGIIQEQK